MNRNQKHLNYIDTVNLGSYYTPEIIVDLAYSILQKNITNIKDFTILDSSCGYGSFLAKNGIAKRLVGVDVDKKAIAEAKKRIGNVDFICQNSLLNVSRKNLIIKNEEKLIAIGNPPYNDTTSIIRNSIKDVSVQDKIDSDIKTRDLGMSFLLSYDKLQADYVCVLHPLSYLIKKANFALLSKFSQNYKLIDGVIISSHEFSDTSRGMAFPILIALYKKDQNGMTYNYIQDYQFKVKDDGLFRLRDFDTIVNYVQKYPNKKCLNKNDRPVAKFWTLRDINALKRNRTFIDSDTYNTVYVLMEKLPYYCYIDVFKQYTDKMPYFIGNCDVIIDNKKFNEIKECFIAQSIHTNPILKSKFKFREIPDAKLKIDNYFRELLGNKFGKKYATNFN
ncbi:MAG: SAM-dependent methyltransferase [Patescibacteria group bacterium]|nr:SAM-dependent methyltransferase [Patescibacteria group bacterium]MDD5490649.1 SAM-dependent methyltransferase [Patescibacteria group bacterium]